MDMYTFALSIAYTNKAIKAAELEGFKVQVETTRDILETVGEEKTFYFLPKVVSEPQNGYDEYIYVNDSWELMGSTDIDLSGYMTLAPLNPTAAQIEAMPSGQWYGDTTHHKGIIKDGQSFYDTNYIDSQFYTKANSLKAIPGEPSIPLYSKFDLGIEHRNIVPGGLRALCMCTYVDTVVVDEEVIGWEYRWLQLSNRVYTLNPSKVPEETITYDLANLSSDTITQKYFVGSFGIIQDNDNVRAFVCTDVDITIDSNILTVTYRWEELAAGNLNNYYTKTQIDTMIGDIETLLSEV